jgi:hypothetical protein
MNERSLTQKEVVLRMICIIGACVCFVHGLRFVYEDVAYHMALDPITVVFTLIPFAPIVAVAPRYKNGSIVYAFIMVLELIVIAVCPFIVVR